MNPVRNVSTYHVQGSSAQPTQATQAHPSAHPSSLGWGRLSHSSVNALNAMKTQGNDQEKIISQFVVDALKDPRGPFELFSNESADSAAQFGMKCNQNAWGIKTNRNENLNYDISSIEHQKGSGKPISIIMPSPLLRLPNELLLQIAGGTGAHGEGVNLNLRYVNRQMKEVADCEMSPKQRFFTKNGQTLHASGHSPAGMLYLVSRPQNHQHFVLTHGQTLRSSGHNPGDMLYLAGRPQNHQHFVLTYGQTLRSSGHSPADMLYLAGRPQNHQHFVLTHGRALRISGHSPADMLHLAGLPENERNTVLQSTRNPVFLDLPLSGGTVDLPLPLDTDSQLS